VQDGWAITVYRCGGEQKRPLFIVAGRGHERIGNENGEIETPELARQIFDMDKFIDIRMVTTQGRHHGAPAGASGEDGPTHCIPYPHK